MSAVQEWAKSAAEASTGTQRTRNKLKDVWIAQAVASMDVEMF